MKLENVLAHYIECALWSSTDNLCRCGDEVKFEPCGEPGCGADNGGSPLDENYDADDLAPVTLARMRNDCADFLELCGEEGLLAVYPHGEEQLGHDFWLTRNGHGAGFWDRGDEELGDELAKWARSFGSCDLYVGDDGKVHAS